MPAEEGDRIGRKNPATPAASVFQFGRLEPNQGSIESDSSVGECSTRRQNSRSFASRSAGLFPAMIEALIAPIEVPITQSGSIPAS